MNQETNKSIDKVGFKIDLVLFAIRMLGTFGVYFSVGLIALLLYWNLEPDPLKIRDTGNNPEWATCYQHDRTFTFEREIFATKTVTVHTEEHMVDIKTGETMILPTPQPLTITKGARVAKCQKKVPQAFLPGKRYEYRPIISYKVNPIKTITKYAPAQKVKVCDSDNPF